MDKNGIPMTCKLCNKDKTLIKAHAIPEAFFRQLRKGEIAPKILSNIPGVHAKKSPIGVYDSAILCQACEDKFAAWDDYGTKTLINKIDTYPLVTEDKNAIACRKEHYDYRKLKLFFISVLWRASVSTHDFYSGVKLGPWENIAKELILNNNPGTEYDFSIVLSKFVSKLGADRLAKTMLSPKAERWNGTNAYRFYLAGITAYIKVDKQKYPDSFEKALVRENTPLQIVYRQLETSRDVKIMIDVVKNSTN